MDGWADKIKILVVCGPTATGKTELAFRLCRHFNGELVGADSMQVYKGLPVGTAAPLPQEFPEVPRHLVSFLPPGQSFSVAEYLAEAKRVISEIAARGRLPVVCGGTGLYINSLVNGICFTEKNIDESFVTKLEVEWDEQGGERMLQRLSDCDPEAAARLHPNDRKRIIRAMALFEAGEGTLAQRNEISRKSPSFCDAKVLGLCYDDRQRLYRQIEARVDRMMTAGLLDEARQVFENRDAYKTAVQAIGYKEFFPYFEGESTLELCVERLKQATRRYAKRQLTWFRHHPPHCWLDADAEKLFEEAAEAAAELLG